VFIGPPILRQSTILCPTRLDFSGNNELKTTQRSRKMSSHHIIADSDDEDGYHSSLACSPVKNIAPANALSYSSLDVVTSNDTVSTDPAFFQRVYNEQRKGEEQVASKYERLSEAEMGKSSVAAESGILLENPATRIKLSGHSSLTSITDPTVSGRHANVENTQDLRDLTQVTTPGRDMQRAKDVWDVPSSPETEHQRRDRTSKVTKLTQKLKKDLSNHSGKTRELNLGGENENMISLSHQSIHNESSYAVTATLDTEQCELAADSKYGRQDLYSDIAQYQIEPTTEQLLANQLADSSGLICVLPNTLSESQKRQYQSMATAIGEGHERIPPPSLPPLITTATSSGTTTVAVTTPSRFASSGASNLRRELSSDDLPSHRKRRQQSTLAEPNSSPDIISISEPPLKKRRNEKQEDSPRGRQEFEHDELGHESYVVNKCKESQHIQQQHKEKNPEINDNQNADCDRMLESNNSTNQQMHHGEVSTASVTPQEKPTTKQRGRKKGKGKESKESTSGSLALDLGVNQPDLTAKAEKRRRGRPKKSDKPSTKADGILLAEVTKVEQQPSNDVADKNLDNKQSAEEESKNRILKDTNPNIALPSMPTSPSKNITRSDPGTDLESTGEINKTESKLMKTPGTGLHEKLKPGFSQGMRPSYRVGLSRRSSIAPLLKFVRK
jgi:hypothetical protein